MGLHCKPTFFTSILAVLLPSPSCWNGYGILVFLSHYKTQQPERKGAQFHSEKNAILSTGFAAQTAFRQTTQEQGTKGKMGFAPLSVMSRLPGTPPRAAKAGKIF